MKSVRIRDAKSTDLPAIVEIYNQTIPGRRSTADLEPVSVRNRRAWFKEHNPTRRPLWVAEQAGRVIGWLSFQSFYGRPAYEGTVEVSIYVGSRYRRKGLGKRFLERAVALAPSLGLHTLLGFIFDHNKSSLRLFEDLGFRRWGHLPRIAKLDAEERGLMIMGRRIDLVDVFFYGSFMDVKVLSKYNLRPSRMETAHAPDYSIGFTPMATIFPSPNSTVGGVVCTLPASALEQAYRVPPLADYDYFPLTAAVKPETGGQREALMYVTNRPIGARPEGSYVQNILRIALGRKFPKRYIQHLRSFLTFPKNKK